MAWYSISSVLSNLITHSGAIQHQVHIVAVNNYYYSLIRPADFDKSKKYDQYRYLATINYDVKLCQDNSHLFSFILSMALLGVYLYRIVTTKFDEIIKSRLATIYRLFFASVYGLLDAAGCNMWYQSDLRCMLLASKTDPDLHDTLQI